MHDPARLVVMVSVWALVTGSVLIALGVLGWWGRLARNRWAGIRTPATVRSEGAWRVAHRAGGLWLAGGGGAAVCGAAVALLVRAEGSAKAGLVWVVAGWAAMLLLAVVGGARGVLAARRAPQ